MSTAEKLVGLGFSKRTDSADFTWALQNRLKSLFNPERSTDSTMEVIRVVYKDNRNISQLSVADTHCTLR